LSALPHHNADHSQCEGFRKAKTSQTRAFNASLHRWFQRPKALANSIPRVVSTLGSKATSNINANGVREFARLLANAFSVGREIVLEPRVETTMS
jgi:hypothetical protein